MACIQALFLLHPSHCETRAPRLPCALCTFALKMQKKLCLFCRLLHVFPLDYNNMIMMFTFMIMIIMSLVGTKPLWIAFRFRCTNSLPCFHVLVDHFASLSCCSAAQLTIVRLAQGHFPFAVWCGRSFWLSGFGRYFSCWGTTKVWSSVKASRSFFIILPSTICEWKCHPFNISCIMSPVLQLVWIYMYVVISALDFRSKSVVVVWSLALAVALFP